MSWEEWDAERKAEEVRKVKLTPAQRKALHAVHDMPEEGAVAVIASGPPHRNNVHMGRPVALALMGKGLLAPKGGGTARTFGTKFGGGISVGNESIAPSYEITPMGRAVVAHHRSGQRMDTDLETRSWEQWDEEHRGESHRQVVVKSPLTGAAREVRLIGDQGGYSVHVDGRHIGAVAPMRERYDASKHGSAPPATKHWAWRHKDDKVRPGLTTTGTDPSWDGGYPTRKEALGQLIQRHELYHQDKGTRMDTGPLGTGSNWVTKAAPATGLGPYIRGIAHALIRSGHDESSAIAIAIGAIQRWARGEGHVHPDTRAKAQAALAYWEALKAKSGVDGATKAITGSSGKRADEFELEFRASGAFAAGHPFEGNQYMSGQNAPVSQQSAGQQLGGMSAAQVYLLASAMQQATGAKVTGQFTVGQLAAVKTALGSAAAAKAAVNMKAAQAAMKKAAAALQAAQAKATAQALHQANANKAAASPVSAGSMNNANLTNSLSAANRASMAASGAIAPAGYTWSGPPGNPTLIPATPLAAAQARQIAAKGAQTAAQKAGQTSAQAKLAAQAAAPGAVPGVSPSAAAASSKPATTASQNAANAMNRLSGTARVKYAKGVPPAGFVWDNSNPASPVLVLAHREDAEALETRGNPRAPQKCKHCADPATSSIIWAEGRAYVPHCAAHRQAVVDKIGGESEVDREVPIEGDRAMAEFASSGPGSNASITTPDSSGAGYLLPNGAGKPPKPREVKTIGPHKFKGSDLEHCEECNRSVTAGVHRARTGTRAMPLSPEPTPPIPASLSKHVATTKAQAASDQDRSIEGFTKALKGHFSVQRSSVLNRLEGKRGRQMLRRAAKPPEFPDGTQDPGQVPPPVVEAGAVGAAGANPAAVDPSAVFDDTFWSAKLIEALEAHYSAAGATAVGRARTQIAAPITLADSDSLAAVDDVLKARAQATAMQVTETTRKAIFEALQQGIANGEGITELATRINAVFDNADTVRAQMIAQTEAVGALNGAVQAYGETLPKDVVGGKIWLAHHDGRTRDTHRLADGQIVKVTDPFWVGGYPMTQPGDQAAPPGETINCRCSMSLLAPGAAAPIVGSSDLEGLIPQTSLDKLDEILVKQADNRKRLTDAAAT